MAIPISVPRLGWSMEEGTFVEWLRQDGDSIKVGDPLFVLESDKAAENIEAIDAGILRISRGGPAPGTIVKVGQVLAHLAAAGEVIQEPTTARPAPVQRPASSSPARPIGEKVQREQPAAIPGTMTPRARRIASELGIDASNLSGSGRHGRIRERDVRAAATQQSPGRLLPHTPTRRTIAARMVAGVTVAAPVTLTTKVDATQLVAQRQRLQAEAHGPVPSYTDMLLALTAAALRQHPALRAQWRDDGLFLPDAIDIAIAVDTEAGLLAPVVRNVDTLALTQIAAQTRDLIEQSRAGRLSADQMRGATLTLTNLGMWGIDAFTPIIHLPQCAVLGIGRIVREPAVVHDQIVPRDQMTLSLTFDHRVVDGAPAARFLDHVRRAVELAANAMASVAT